MSASCDNVVAMQFYCIATTFLQCNSIAKVRLCARNTLSAYNYFLLNDTQNMNMQVAFKL